MGRTLSQYPVCPVLLPLWATLLLIGGQCAWAQTAGEPPAPDKSVLEPANNPPSAAPATLPATRRASDDVIARIREEGLNHSQVNETLSYLSDVIGPRLTGSPNLRRANEWTRQRLSSWGLVNAHLEAWGPFGRGWSLKRFSAQVIEPQDIPLIGFPKAWTRGFDRPL